MHTLKLSKSVYSQIINTVGMHPPETGGILGSAESGVITDFYFDEYGISSINGYAPDVLSINEMLIRDWMPRNILMVGIVHSHANGIAVPSCGDINYGIRILQALDMVDRFYLPIVTWNNGEMGFTCYVICKNDDEFICKSIPYVLF